MKPSTQQRVEKKKKKNSLQCPVCGVIGHKSWEEAVEHQGSAEPPTLTNRKEPTKGDKPSWKTIINFQIIL